MATEIIVPKVDMVMENATFVEWLKAEGEPVQRGEGLFVIQTDKAAIEVEALDDGVLAGCTAVADDLISVASVIGFILKPGESLPHQEKLPSSQTLPASMPKTKIPEDSIETTVFTDHPEIGQPEKAIGIRATPLARGLARDLNLDLQYIQGSGPRGRIYRADVERYSKDTVPLINHNQSEQQTGVLPDSMNWPSKISSRIPMKGPRAIIARRMLHSVQTIPHIHISIQVDMSEAVRMRDKLNSDIGQIQSDTWNRHQGITYTAIIARAVAYLLKKYPLLNSSLINDEIVIWEDVHLGIATQLDDYLVVPVIRAAQNLRLDEISKELTRLVEQARLRKLQPSEMVGSTVTISNLGMLGAASFTAIINPPEVAILAVGKIADIPVVIGTEITIRPVMNITLAVDHRVVDGALATRFLNDLKKILENLYLLV